MAISRQHYNFGIRVYGMYKVFFGITEAPFSIVPSARFLYLSDRHREALGYMLSGLQDGGGLALLTGEVGTGKTTIMRGLLAQIPENTQTALVLNPALSAHELLHAICDGLEVHYEETDSYKKLIDRLNQHLLMNDQQGKQTLLLIDEAQHLMPDVLEQLRLLTNLETDSRKLLKVVLIGQPELQQVLQQPSLRQLAQRITSRYHLLPLTEQEVEEYIRYRLSAVNCLHNAFERSVVKIIAEQTQGIPRLINLVCDKAMQLAAKHSTHQISKPMVSEACHDVLQWQVSSTTSVLKPTQEGWQFQRSWWLAMIIGGLLSASAWQWRDHWLTPVLNWQYNAAPTMDVLTPPSSISTPASIESTTDVSSSKPLPDFQQLISLSQNEQAVMRVLYQTWGYDVALSQATCLSSSRIALACHSGKTNLNRLLLINRPASVSLKTATEGTFHAVLFAVNASTVELLLAGSRISVSRAWFEQHWQGDYTLLWRPPLEESSSIRYGQQGQRVAWLNKHLNQLLNDGQHYHDQFDQMTLDKLRRFQRAQNLTVDGIAGSMTLMVIDATLNLPGPVLHKESL